MLNLILLQAETGAAQQGNSWSFWVMMILIFVVFYFFMIRPQTQKQKELQKKHRQNVYGEWIDACLVLPYPKQPTWAA